MSKQKTCQVLDCQKPVVAKGLCITHYKRQRRGQDIFTREKRVGEPSGHGRYGIIDGDDKSIMCHECGEHFSSVAGHIYRAHGLRAKAYKDKHGLPRGTALIAPELARRQAENTQRRLGSDDWKRFEKACDPEKAAHARTGEDFRRRGVARDNARESGTQRIRGKRKRVHDGVCRVCGESRGAGRSPFMTCARPVCEQILRYRNRNGADGEMLGRIDRAQAGGATWKMAAEGTGMSQQSARLRVLSLRRHQLRVMGAVSEGVSVDAAWWERPAGGVGKVTPK